MLQSFQHKKNIFFLFAGEKRENLIFLVPKEKLVNINLVSRPKTGLDIRCTRIISVTKEKKYFFAKLHILIEPIIFKTHACACCP